MTMKKQFESSKKPILRDGKYEFDLDVCDDLKAKITVGSKEEKKRFKDLLSRVAKSKTGYELIKNAYENKYKLVFVNMHSNGSVNFNKSLVSINPNVGNDQLISTIAHELRHVKQKDNILRPDCYKNTVESNLKTFFANEADATLYGAIVAWELKQKGDNKAWEGIIKKVPKEAKIIEEKTKPNEALSNNTKTNVFKQWFYNKNNLYNYSRSMINFYNSKLEKGKFVKNFSFKSDPSSSMIINQICHNNKDKDDNYFVQSKDFLENLPVGLVIEKHKKDFIEFAQNLEKMTGIKEPTVHKLQTKSKQNNPIYVFKKKFDALRGR